jgi:hypothetical protein
LLDIGVIEKYRIGKEYKYKIKIEHDMWLFLIKYQNALSDKTIDIFLRWLLSYESKKQVDNGLLTIVMEVVFDIFPHPYFG